MAGNHRDAVVKGGTRRISGVAPRANIVAFDVCFTDVQSGGGSCPNTATLAAVNQAVADGVVDVINYSIGGGVSPWSESVSLAFLNAVDAGIYVAASAGNSGPGPNTMGHHRALDGVHGGVAARPRRLPAAVPGHRSRRRAGSADHDPDA